MTPAMVSGIAQTVPQISPTAISKSSPEQQKNSSLKETPVAAKTNESVAVDSISISQQARKAITNGGQEASQKNNLEKKNPVQENSNVTSSVTAKVQFEYDLKGDLVTKYVDSSERIIYQIPSELKLRLAEFVSKSDSSLNTKV